MRCITCFRATNELIKSNRFELNLNKNKMIIKFQNFFYFFFKSHIPIRNYKTYYLYQTNMSNLLFIRKKNESYHIEIYKF